MPAPHHTIARTSLLLAMVACLAAGTWYDSIEQNPPVHPLGRGKLKKWETKVRLSVGEPQVTEPFGEGEQINNAFNCAATKLVFPLVLEGNYTRTNPDSIRVTGMIGDRWQTENVPWKLRGPNPDGTVEVVLSFPEVQTSIIGMEISWIAESWVPTINEKEAALATWPRTWPEEAAPYLEPSRFIDSKDSAVVEFVESITGGRQRSAPPYLVAKEITRSVVGRFRQVNESVTKLTSLTKSLSTRTGTPADMVCLAVASLRASGIPARPVVGVGSYLSSGLGKEVNSWILWCEFYLPNAGWVTFDPNEMRGKGIQLKALTEPWPWFGYEKEMNERTAISYRMMIPGSLDPQECFAYYNALWDETGGGTTGAPMYLTMCYWGWMKATCDEQCEPQQSSITRTNRTGSLFHR